MKITAPGIYKDFPESEYYADPCPLPSLTQSIAKVLLAQAPLHAWHAHPRLNPDFQRDDDRKFDVGTIAHKLMIGRGKDLVLIEADDWRTKAAQTARADAAKDGKLGVLGKHMARADKMVKAAREQFELRQLGHLFRDGHGEVVTAWEENGVWLRQMIDFLSGDHRTFVDYKTTDMSVAPPTLGRMMVNAGWHIQAAMGERGLNALDGENAGRRRYLFVVQEATAPYCLNVVEVGEAALTLGRKQLDMAVAHWSLCMSTDRWPGYPLEIVRPEIPGWFEVDVLKRELEEDARREGVDVSQLLMAG